MHRGCWSPQRQGLHLPRLGPKWSKVLNKVKLLLFICWCFCVWMCIFIFMQMWFFLNKGAWHGFFVFVVMKVCSLLPKSNVHQKDILIEGNGGDFTLKLGRSYYTKHLIVIMVHGKLEIFNENIAYIFGLYFSINSIIFVVQGCMNFLLIIFTNVEYIFLIDCG